MGLLDIYPDGQSRADAAKILLQQFLLDHDRLLGNPLMVDHVLSIARILHDTLKSVKRPDREGPDRRELQNESLGHSLSCISSFLFIAPPA